MALEKGNLFTRNAGEGDVVVHIFKAIFISLTLTIGAIVIHLEHNNTTSSESTNQSTPPSLQTPNPTIYTNSYSLTVSLIKATDQLQDAISLILSSYSGSDVDIDAELAWKNCSGSVLNGWGEIQDVVEHVMMNPFMERPSDEQRGETSQIMAAEGFIESCLDDLDKVESTAAGELRAKLLLAKVYLSGGGAFLTSYHDEIWNRVVIATWGIILGNLLYIVFLWGTVVFRVVYVSKTV